MSRYAGNPIATAILRESRDELELHRNYSEYYGDVFLVLALAKRPAAR